ncbi:MAG: hypothetical protein OXC69_05995 [Candidatus Tectomicrobia bacterium]|nr:hypothetical protein [Candidatus Tectomicrobia bacterium]
MTQNAHVTAREPVFDSLGEAARRGLELQLTAPPSRAGFLSAAIGEALDPRHQVKESHRYRKALDTTIALCANNGGKRLVPTGAHRVERPIARCFALYDLPCWCVTNALERLGSVCPGGVPASSLKDLGNPVRVERTRRPLGDGADYPALARCHDLAPGASAGLSTPAEPQAVTEMTPSTEEHIIAPFLNLHAIPGGVC